MSARPASSAGSAFDPRVVLGLLLVGAVAFLAALYLIGAGRPVTEENDGGGHAASTGLTGYAALAGLLRERGDQVNLIRNPSRLGGNGLLILTPPAYAEAEAINEIIENRRFSGPTLIVLPKWTAMRVPPGLDIEAGRGWVVLLGSDTPDWASDLFGEGRVDVRLDKREGQAARWHGLGLSGELADASAVQTVSSDVLTPIVEDARGQNLVSYLDDGEHFPVLGHWSDAADRANPPHDDAWPVVLVADPDLMDNYGLADRDRAMLALGVIDAAMEGQQMPIAFDLTLNGLGGSANLLTLAFTPPFLAATLCLLIAAFVVGWRAFRRFGPPVAELPPIAFGKLQLARNGANLIQRSRRLHLLGPPYAALLRTRVARLLGLRPSSDAAQMEADIEQALARRGLSGFAEGAEALRHARKAHELLRGAHALREIERKLQR